jgi:hypothetical protein
MKIRNQIQFDQLRKYFDSIDDSLYAFSYSKNVLIPLYRKQMIY